MGRHAASGSDGVDWGDAPVAAGRRRTDGPDALWSGSPAAGLSDQATDIGRLRADRRRDSVLDSALEAGRRPGARPAAGPPAPGGVRTPDAARPMSRSRLPLPPVPAGSRPTGPRTTGPRTTMAPFQAVPSPEIPAPAVAADVLAPVPAPAGAPTERRRSRSAAPAVAPAAGRAGRSWRAEGPEHKVVVADAPAKAGRGSVPGPRLGRPGTPAGAPSPAYGDWTKPSRAELAEMAASDEADFLSGPIAAARLQPAPGTSAIPERSVAGRRARYDDAIDDADEAGHDNYDLEDEPAPATAGPVRREHMSGPVTGGRAARRAELQAADQARKEAAKRNGTPIISPLDEEKPPRRSRVLMGLVAMVVVALGVLGVYQVTAPKTGEAASQASAGTTTSAEVPSVSALPTLPTAPVVVEPKVDPALKAPVTVLNATKTTGLAAKIAAAIKGGGWETPAIGTYTGTDVAATTVFFTKGNETQRQAALNLMKQFSQVVSGPTPRFFEMPAGIAAPGLVVVITGDWMP